MNLSRAVPGLVVVILLIAPLLLYVFQDRVHPPAPPPLELSLPDPEAAEYRARGEAVPLEAAGFHLKLPPGTRIHPNTLIRRPGLVRIQARLPTISFWASFYGDGAGTLAESFRSALGSPSSATGPGSLLGSCRVLGSQRRAHPDGEILEFELQREGSSQRETVLVLLPREGDRLATLTARFSFDPGAVRLVRRIGDQARMGTS